MLRRLIDPAAMRLVVVVGVAEVVITTIGLPRTPDAAAKMLEEKPEDLVRLAVKGMLPKNRLSRKLVTKLKVYAGSEHPHDAQKPQPLAIVA